MNTLSDKTKSENDFVIIPFFLGPFDPRRLQYFAGSFFLCLLIQNRDKYWATTERSVYSSKCKYK